MAADLRDPRKRLEQLRGNDRKRGSIAFHKKLGHDTTAQEYELAELEEETVPLEAELTQLESLLAPYNAAKQAAGEARRVLRELKQELLTQLQMKRNAMTGEDCRALVLSIFCEDLEDTLLDYISEHRRTVVRTVENWWDKYSSPLRVIEPIRDQAVVRLKDYLKQLDYE